MVSFIEFALSDLKILYIFPEKIQTDMLEKQFSKYCNLAGNNYNVLGVQVCTSTYMRDTA